MAAEGQNPDVRGGEGSRARNGAQKELDRRIRGPFAREGAVGRSYGSFLFLHPHVSHMGNLRKW